MAHNPQRQDQPRVRGQRRGVSFLEVVLAMVLLGLAAATIASVIGFVSGMQRREAATLGAAEVANRMVLQHLLNPRKLPPRGIPIEYLGDEYRWEITVTPVDYTVAPEVELAIAENSTARASTPFSVDQRLDRIAVTAWLAETSGGSYSKDGGAPRHTVVRLADRVNIGRNPAIQRRLIQAGDAGIRELMDMVTNNQSTDAQPQSPARSGQDSGGER